MTKSIKYFSLKTQKFEIKWIVDILNKNIN